MKKLVCYALFSGILLLIFSYSGNKLHSVVSFLRRGIPDKTLDAGSDVRELSSVRKHATKRLRYNNYKDAPPHPVGITEQQLINASGGVIHLKGAGLLIPPLALADAKLISITVLPVDSMPTLDPELINVTTNNTGFRFLPHGTLFEREAKIILPYDENLIPHGYTPEDISTFFFNTATHQWEPLKKVFTNKQSMQVISATTHFTDMINGIIKIPEMPVTEGYTPTTFKNMNVADPSEGIKTMEPPTATNMGNLTLGYSLKLPAGRQNMQPDLSLQYNSEAGDGWLGVGWSLAIPSVTIETRWGVPRFRTDVETETYLINGEQLGPVAHRSAPVNRTTDRLFHLRVENSFRKIVRHGDHPNNYWWEITEKNGTRSYFGGTPATGLDISTVLTDASGNVVHWALTETRDLNDNFIKYHYKKITDAGVPGGNVPGYQLYIDNISYTGHGNTEGKYSALFTYDRDLHETKRKDVIINGRLGFKQVTADLLRKIEIQYNGADIRSYELKYVEGAFFKTLLKDIIEYDAAGVEFSRHQLGYYDDVRSDGVYHPFGAEETWNPQNDGIHGNFLNPTTLFGDHASALGASKSSGFGAGLTVTAGVFDGRLFNKSSTAGASFGYSNYKNEGLLAFIDINGDGLRDKVFKKNGQLFFRPNESGPDGQLRFGDIHSITGITDFDKGTTRTIDAGIESNFLFFAGVQYSNTKNEKSSYFTDANGDQLIDIVNQGTVFFNHRDANGNISFTPSSSNTPSPIQSISSIDNSLVSIDSTELLTQENNNPLHDVVRVWKAPYDGIISVSGEVQLVEDTSPDRQAYTSADGVRVAIQLNASELWNTLIDENDYVPKIPQGVNSIQVMAGDRLYFRVQSIYDGAYDQVKWAPVITYINYDPGAEDANGHPTYQFNASTDFLASTAMSVGMPINGQVQISGAFEKPITSDDLHVEIVRKTATTEQVIWQNDLAWYTLTTDSINLTQTVDKGDDFYFRVSAATNVEWTTLKWMPRIYYVASFDTSVIQVINDQGQPIIDFYPVVEYKVFNKIIQPSIAWVAAQNDSITIAPILQMSTSTESGDITFSVKKKNALITKETIQVMSGVASGSSPVSIVVNQNDSLYIEYHSRNQNLWNVVTAAEAGITGSNINDTTIVAGATIYTEESHQFGTMYRHWGQFVYNGNHERANLPINESELVIDSSLATPDSIDLSNATDEQDMQNMYNGANGDRPNDDKFVYMVPSASSNAWNGYDDLTFVTQNIISSSRMGDDNLLPVSPLQGPGSGTGAGATAINKISKTENVNVAGGVSLGISIGGGYSTGWTTQLYEYMDMNGDSYPDILSKNKIQYTLPFGGLDATAITQSFDEVEKMGHRALGITAGGTFLSSSTFNTRKENRGSKASNAGSDGKSTLGVSGNLNVNHDSTSISWIDINGDGLADRVHRGGGVELNLGYKFAPTENWGYVGISDGNTIAYGGGIGIDIGNYSIAGGVGLNRNENNLNKSLRDVNGDGLPDYVTDRPIDIVVDSHPLMVSINTGNGFAQPVEWTGANSINEDVSTGESANIAFTACIPITPLTPVAKVCFNPFTVVAHGVSREKIQLTDIDGDDYPDYLESEKDNDLKIKRSLIRRTNLLKTVRRPMGASFEVDYTRKGNTPQMPGSLWALSSVKIFDGVPGDGNDTTLTSVEYANGFYDRNEREFYGFGTVKINEHNTGSGNTVYRSTVRNFLNNDYYHKGLLSSEYLQDSSGNKFNETLYTYTLKNVQSGALLPPGSELSDREEAFPALTETKMLIYEGQTVAGKSTHMLFSYDAIGNMTSQTDYGDTDPSDDFTTQITYFSVADKYLMDVPRTMTIVNGTGQTLRKQEQDIDPLTGDITEIRNFSGPTAVATTNMTYDAYGNTESIIRPKNANGQRLKYSYQYDQEVNTYVTSIEDSYGYVSSDEYDVRFGRILTDIDINNQKTTNTIDNAGRITTITGPIERAASVPFTISFEYHPDAEVPWAYTRHYDPQHPGNFIETVSFMDGLKKPIQIKKDGALFNTPNGNDIETMLVSGAVIYDAFGRQVGTYYPTTEAKGNESVYNRNRDTIAPTVTIYDILDRPIEKILPDGTHSSVQFGFGTDRNGIIQCSKQLVDANGIKSIVFTDIRGRITSTKRYFSQGNDIWTSFQYNPINELIAAIDNKQNTITAEYDWLGRRTALNHPDAGITTWQYDAAGQITKKITANLRSSGKSIQYHYDHERLKKIIYPYNHNNDVTYHYGQRNDPYNRAGRIKVQEDGSGAQEFFYNPIGDVVKNIRTIILPYYGCETYKMEWTYDTWNRIQTMTYPDGEKLEYKYNTGGLLSQIRGKKDYKEYDYLKQRGYDKFEKTVYLRYGNGTETFYTYEPARRRLKQLQTETASNRKIRDINYTFDHENNILDLANDVPLPRNNQLGGSTEYHFEYDDLYRLTGATGEFSDRTHQHRYDLSMQYNSVGSIIKKDQCSKWKPNNSSYWHIEDETTYSDDYEYDHHDRPHAPVTIGDRVYTYDKNGNQTGWGIYERHHFRQQRTINWDEEDRISSINEKGALFNYTYDADDQRVLKYKGGHHHVKINGQTAGRNNSSDDYTIYVNPWVVVDDGSLMKHVFMEDQRIVSKPGERNDHYRHADEKAGQSADVLINYERKEMVAKKALADLATESDTELPGATGNEPNQDNARGTDDNHQRDPVLYFFHPDHLGNSNFVTDAKGEAIRQIEYLPYGETFTDDRTNNSSDETPYLYNGKELDDETGLYYYGARYYDARTSVWQSADPDKENFPAWSPYSYSFLNPVNFHDPDGRAPDEVVSALQSLRSDDAEKDYSYVSVARDFFEGFTKPISYTFQSKTNRVFWSGGTMNEAKIFAEKIGAITLEMTFEGKRLEALSGVRNKLAANERKRSDEMTGVKIAIDPETKKEMLAYGKEGKIKMEKNSFDAFHITEGFWKQLSTGYATGAKIANVVRRRILRAGNIWEANEKPILEKNNIRAGELYVD